MDGKQTFESCVSRIDEIAGILSAGTAELEESVQLYREANELLAKARQILAEAEVKITEISSAAGE